MSTARYLASRFKGNLHLKYAYAADPNRQIYDPEPNRPIRYKWSKILQIFRVFQRRDLILETVCLFITQSSTVNG